MAQKFYSTCLIGCINCAINLYPIFIQCLKGKTLSSTYSTHRVTAAENEVNNDLLFNQLKKLFDLKECSVVLKRLVLRGRHPKC